MPDFFEPEQPFDIAGFPPKDDEGKAALQAFFGGIASPPDNVKKATVFGQFLKGNGVKRVGLYGMCWGNHYSHPYIQAMFIGIFRWKGCRFIWW